MDKPAPITRIFRVAMLCVTAFLFLQLITLYLSWQKQAVLGVTTTLIGLVANRASKSRQTTLLLMLISMTATFRYGWWRFHLLIDFFSDESNQRIGLNAAFLLLLISAETYTIIIMLLGYMQTAWPLRRMPIPLPNDDSQWPHVDLLIPTYNEPLSLVRYTALAALNIDYPPEKLHVYILDDGTREDFAEFAAEAGVGYITRAEHGHAKAGNINHALSTMDSPYVAIFDCDHVPTRSFLQMTLGWMLADARLGMLQTPHHFYSPDPFERNLLQYKTIPNEAELFYGIVQDGNDFWNATFFCGSCALIRRTALDSVGGIATETVTEDAHTSLRMQRRGYNTAYINIPQAAGLATESLAAHVGQRIRWARGMIQILRTDNPLFGRGLKFTQRLCYFNAMIHFLYSVPRLVFLGAPLVYLLLGRTIIPGYWVAILTYALPHLILSSLTNSRIQGRHRHSFWNEIYEAVLAPYILAPTLLALINPKLGKFNVTSKGNTTGQTQFDRKIATPTRWILIMNFCGLIAVPYRLLITDPQHPGAVIMNMVWVLFNIVILGVAAAVAHEQKQRRESVRIEAKIPVQLRTARGRQIDTVSLDMSVGGASIRIPPGGNIAVGELVKLAFPSNTGNEEIRAQVVGIHGQALRVAFMLRTIAEQEILTRALYSRADAWLGSSNVKEVDRPLVSLGRVIVLSTHGIYQVFRSLFPEKKIPRSPARTKTATIALLMFVGLCGRSSAAGLPPQSTGLSPETGGSNRQVLSLRDAGMKSEIDMHGPHSYFTANFTLSHQLVPKQGILHLNYSLDPTLDPRSTSLQINLNGTVITTLHPESNANGESGATRLISIDIPISNLLLVRTNTLTFEFIGSGVMERENEARQHILCRLFPSSTFEVSGDWLRLGNDLSQLPLPLLDSELLSTTTIPFVFFSQPTPILLEASGVVASWFGAMGGSKPVRFTTSFNNIPSGNAVIFASRRAELPASLQIPDGNGPFIALRDNPSDDFGTLLVLAGGNEGEVLTAAQSLALIRKPRAGSAADASMLKGDIAEAAALAMPPVRTRDDAPRWMPISKTAPLTDCSAEGRLQTDGSSPLPVYFHLPPELFFGEKQNLILHLNYRYDARLVGPGSALRVVLNGSLAAEIVLPPASGVVENQRTILVPVADFRPFGNTLLFNFDFVPANRDPATSPVLSGEVLCNSSLDLSGLALWTRMPNLKLFAEAGFPFTQFADLSRTNVVLPAAPSVEEISLYLHLMSLFGSQTGYPAIRVTVTGPNSDISAGRDYLILGTIADQPAFNSLSALLPVALDGSAIYVKTKRGLAADIDSLRAIPSRLWSMLTGKGAKLDGSPTNDGPIDAAISEVESPVSPDHSIVAIVLQQDASANRIAGTLLDPSTSAEVGGSLSLVRNSTLSSVPNTAAAYHAGSISWYAMMRIYLTRYYLLLLLLVLFLCLKIARYAYGWMAWRASDRLKLSQTPLD
ncbi:MAG TPA: UDP-forming cellulose synthase catalytic subunit [Terracidiphilus sp.]